MGLRDGYEPNAGGGDRRRFVWGATMGDCRYCGKSAGFLRKEHKACADAHEEGLESIRKVCVEAALYVIHVDRLTDSVRSIGVSSFIDTSVAAMTAALARGWGKVSRMSAFKCGL